MQIGLQIGLIYDVHAKAAKKKKKEEEGRCGMQLTAVVIN
jgi:hypothetical protein